MRTQTKDQFVAERRNVAAKEQRLHKAAVAYFEEIWCPRVEPLDTGPGRAVRAELISAAIEFGRSVSDKKVEAGSV